MDSNGLRLMRHQMDQLLKRLYGKTSKNLDPNQLLMADVLLEADKQTLPGQEDAPVTTTVVKEHVRHKHGRSPLPEHLPRVEHRMDIKDLEKACRCGKPLKLIGDDVTEHLEYQPSSLFVNVYRRPKYACPDCDCDGCGVKQAPMPDGPIARCEADCGMLAHVIVEKFEHHMPLALLYKIEQDYKHATAEERLARRQKESRPIVDKIEAWLKANMANHLPQSPMRRAIDHMLRIWKELNVYLTDGRIPIDNNLAENAIRPIALGRKNWLFVGSETGGHTAAVLMSFTATCRKHKINTWAYLKDVLQRINGHSTKKLYELLPDQWRVAQ